jgi:hypothetical protein
MVVSAHVLCCIRVVPCWSKHSPHTLVEHPISSHLLNMARITLFLHSQACSVIGDTKSRMETSPDHAMDSDKKSMQLRKLLHWYQSV